MTIKEHRKWKRWFLDVASKQVAVRDYKGAAHSYLAAAHHDAVIVAFRKLKK